MPIEKGTATLIQNVVRKTGWIELPAEGNSMYPLIRPGDICRFISCEPSVFKKGEIVLFFTSSRQLVAHRFSHTRTLKSQQRFFFKGDANLSYDDSIGEEQIIGKLTLIQRDRVRIRTNRLPAFIWGRLVLTFPALSGLLRNHLNRKYT